MALVAVVGAALYIRLSGEGAPPDVSGYPVRGIDVSAHNGDIDFGRVAADSIQFVYMKATEGTDFCDSRFHHNYYAAREAGLKVGAYHFFRFDRPADMQAVNLLHAIRGMELDLPLAIDVEEWTNREEITPEWVAGVLHALIDYLRQRGHEVVLYANKNDYEHYLRKEFAEVPLWIATFSQPAPSLKWTFWQYSHRGSVDGIKGAVDLDVYAGESLPSFSHD